MSEHDSHVQAYTGRESQTVGIDGLHSPARKRWPSRCRHLTYAPEVEQEADSKLIGTIWTCVRCGKVKRRRDSIRPPKGWRMSP